MHAEEPLLRRTLMTGGALALAAGLLTVHGGRFGLEASRIATFGIVLGAVLALAGEATPTGRTAAFAIGFGATWAAYAARAAVLPDIPLGRGVAAFAVVAVVTAAAAGSRDRLPLWAGLLGAGLMTGAYETTFTTTPPAFATESVTAATGALLAAAAGYAVALALREGARTKTAPPREIHLPPDAVPAQRGAGVSLPTRAEV